MNKFVFWFLTVVIVLARCSAESIPAINKTSGFAVAHSSQAVERNKEAPHEEREFFDIDSFISSVKAADESLPGTIHAVNMVDVPQMKKKTRKT